MDSSRLFLRSCLEGIVIMFSRCPEGTGNADIYCSLDVLDVLVVTGYLAEIVNKLLQL
jgi:hypothetical protein